MACVPYAEKPVCERSSERSWIGYIACGSKIGSRAASTSAYSL
jgi:hypothetical protein